MTEAAAPSPAPPAPPASPADADGDERAMTNSGREKLWWWLCGAVGFLAPLSFNVGYFLNADKKRNFIAGMDVAVVALILVALANWRRIPALIKAVPKTVWLFIAVIGLAILGTVAVGTNSFGDLWAFKFEILKKVVGNYVEYLLIAPVLIAMLVNGRKRRLGMLMKGMLVAGLVAAVSGCVDFWNPAVLDVDVAGLFDHRNLLGGVLAMLAPLAAAMVIFERCQYTRPVAAVLLVIGLWCQTTAGALLGIVGGVFAVCAFAWIVRKRFRRCSFKIVGVAGLTLATLVASNRLSPRAATSDNFTAAQIAAKYRGYSLQPRSQMDAALESIAPFKYDDPTDPQSPKTRLSDRARRWQAQINLIRANMFGCGTGLYQKTIGAYYGGPYSKPTMATDVHEAWGAEVDEPGSFGMYNTVAAEAGIGGMVALLAVLFAGLARAAGRVLDAPAMGLAGGAPETATSATADPHGRAATKWLLPFDLYAGMFAFAMLSGAALFGIFHDPIASRGPAGVVAVALGLTIAWGMERKP